MSMEDRSAMKSGRLEKHAENSRKHKKRSKKANSIKIDNWCTEGNSINNEPVPGIDYTPMFWQQPGAAPHVQPIRNDQRLFTAMSDPGVCGYSTMPVAYTMEPVSVYPLYRPVPQPYRAIRGRVRRNIHQSSSQAHQNNVVNGYSSLQDNRPNFLTPSLYQNGDYTSLPPTANHHMTNDNEELNSEHRRYSDPGLGPADLPNYTNSENSDSGESGGSSITTIGKNNKLVLSLVEQMTALREVNSQMFKQLHETKLSLESVKVELGRMRQQVSVEYQPGMLSDIISEMRQANKKLDETIDARINTAVDERSQQKSLELQKLKDRLAKLTEDKTAADKRIVKLEEEVAALKMTNNDDQEIAALEEETLNLRRELQEARAPRNVISSQSAKLEKLVAILHHRKMNDISKVGSTNSIGYSKGSTVDDIFPHMTNSSKDNSDNEGSDGSGDSIYSINESVVSSNVSSIGPVTDL